MKSTVSVLSPMRMPEFTTVRKSHHLEIQKPLVSSTKWQVLCYVIFDPSNFIMLKLPATSYLGLMMFDWETPVHLCLVVRPTINPINQ